MLALSPIADSGALPALPQPDNEGGFLTARGALFYYAQTHALDRGHQPPHCPVMANPPPPDDTLARLERTITARMSASPDSSYVAKLNARGVPEIAKKLGEEAVELVIASLAGSREELIGEAADVLFHLLVLMCAKGVALADVLAELSRREDTSGLAEKAGRSA